MPSVRPIGNAIGKRHRRQERDVERREHRNGGNRERDEQRRHTTVTAAAQMNVRSKRTPLVLDGLDISRAVMAITSRIPT